MGVNQLAPNVVAYEPEEDPSRIDPAELLNSGWSGKLVECLRRNQSGFQGLREFERSQAERYEAEAPAIAITTD